MTVKSPEPSLPAPQPIDTPSGLAVKRKLPWKKILLFGGGGLLLLIIATLLSGWFWYQAQLSPRDPNMTERIKVTVEQYSTPAQIGALLEEKDIIRNAWAFTLYARLSGTQDSLQAGTYRLSASESVPEVIGHLTSGKVDTFDITFLPGATLADNRQVFLDAGYSEEETDEALAASYESPLFAGKPASADLEGYIYGETYKFSTDATVEDILNYVFEVYLGVIEDNGIQASLEEKGLTLYQGITLASIVQRESGGGDEAQIAQVFYSRLAIGMVLGSDVTYQYIADKTGVARDPNLDSPYNTRRYPGLPPGPIAVPGVNALKAVAEPAEGDYLFFLSGDDDVTYFARTNAEHEQNIVDHCQKKCLIL
jgi:UPF0755 protein